MRVRGQSIFPPNILGRFAILCAILRQFHLVLQIWASGELAALKPDAFFVDQLSACVPLLRVFHPHTRTLFYCHFPDKLLANRQSWIQETYRLPFDWIEAWTTGAADSLVVNSKFTRGVFAKAFPRLSGRTPAVVYPCVKTKGEQPEKSPQPRIWGGQKVILSINRFERKKGIELAINAFAGMAGQDRQARLVVAGMQAGKRMGYL